MLYLLKIISRANLHHGLLQPIRVDKPFELVGIGKAFLSKTKDGFNNVLIAIDYFNKRAEANVMKSLEAEAFFKIIISKHGCPECLMSDSGSELKSEAFATIRVL